MVGLCLAVELLELAHLLLELEVELEGEFLDVLSLGRKEGAPKRRGGATEEAFRRGRAISGGFVMRMVSLRRRGERGKRLGVAVGEVR